ncbi:MAG TPA: hypothetical protein VIO11_01475 [Candidatus Methanoperedens sp.]
MLDLKILVLMFKEEFRLHASFFNRSHLCISSLAIMLFTFIMGLSLPGLRHVVATGDMLLVVHWVIFFYGLGTGGFAFFGKRFIERRFGSISLLLGSGSTLPVRFKRLFFIFYLKDTIYYIIFTILPMILGLALASGFVSISILSLIFLFFSLTLSFLLGIGLSVLLFTVVALWNMSLIVMLIAGGLYIGLTGINLRELAVLLPPFRFYYSHSVYIVLEVLIISVILGVISSLLIKEAPAPHERRAIEMYRKMNRPASWLAPGFGPLLSKDMIDLVRSGMIFSIIFTFLPPLLFLYAVTWFIESVMLLDLGFSLLFYAAMVGFLSTLVYSWLSSIDISECYNSLPLSMPHVIRSKLMLFLVLTAGVSVPYLAAVGYSRGEMNLFWIGLIIVFPVSVYVGSILAYFTGLFTNSYLLDAKILLEFALLVVPVLVAETLLSFYYPANNIVSIIFISGLGLAVIAVSIIFLNRLDDRWNGKMFRIA